MNNRKNNIINMLVMLSFVLFIIAAMFFLTSIVRTVFANQIATETDQVTVPSTCEVSLSPTSFSFGSQVAPGNKIVTNSPNGGVGDTNQGNSNTFIWISGSNWIGNAITVNFYVVNTVWNPANSLGSQIGNQLTLSAINTLEFLPNSTTNTLWFGLNIPNQQTANIYTQNIVFTNVC